MEKNIDRTDTGGRSGFGIHPDGGKFGTLGCIGISKEIKNTSLIENMIRYFINQYGELKVYVVP